MQITLKERGGFGAAALMQAAPRSVQVDTLGDDAVSHVRRLLTAAQNTERDRSAEPSGAPQMSYVITVRDDGREQVLEFQDEQLATEAEDLIAWIKQHS